MRMEAEAPEIALRVRGSPLSPACTLSGGSGSAATLRPRCGFWSSTTNRRFAPRSSAPCGSRVTTSALAADGAEALQRLSLHTPDAVVLDV